MTETMAAPDAPITFPTADNGYAHVRIRAKTAQPWTTQVELNGVGIPCNSVKYEAAANDGLAQVTITFPAIVDIDVAIASGQLTIKQDPIPAPAGATTATSYEASALPAWASKPDPSRLKPRESDETTA